LPSTYLLIYVFWLPLNLKSKKLNLKLLKDMIEISRAGHDVDDTRAQSFGCATSLLEGAQGLLFFGDLSASESGNSVLEEYELRALEACPFQFPAQVAELGFFPIRIELPGSGHDQIRVPEPPNGCRG